MSAPAYCPRLDGLRAVAVGFVMIEHLIPVPAIHRLGLGFAGVDLFFVLSGFLITRILIDLRDSRASMASAATYFFWRRILRLVPALYAAILVVAALGGMRDNWWIHALYLSNFQVAFEGRWNDASHFWTLSVEEQFYLLWFAIVMMLPKRLLLPASIAFLVLANLFRATLWLSGASFYLVVLLPGVCDGLAAGSIVAIVLQDDRRSLLRDLLRSRLAFLICIVGVAGMLIVPFTRAPGLQPVLWMWMTFFAAIVVAEAAGSAPHPALDWLKAPPLRHIGKISYSIYIWHYFVGQALPRLDPVPFAAHSTGGKIAVVVGAFAASVLVAQVSWLVIEQPILRLKKRSDSLLVAGPDAPLAGLALSGTLRSSGA